MSKSFERKLSPSERLWVAIDQVNPNFGVQICLTGEGELDLERFRAALAEASAANPGSRFRLGGHLVWSRWRDSGQTPPIEVVESTGWDARSPRGMPRIEQRLDAHRGPTTGVVVLRGDPPRIFFNALHATMDGVGLVTWMEDVFRVLRGETPIGSTSTVSDYELARGLRAEKRKVPLDSVCYAATGRAGAPPWRPGFDWRRVTIPGRASNLLSRVVRIVADSAWALGEGDGGGPGQVRITVPVDMRRHHDRLRTTSNLTSGVVIQIAPETSAEDIRNEIVSQIKDLRDLDLVRLLDAVVYVPLGAMRYAILRETGRCHARGRYPSTATVSTLGRFELGAYDGGGFRTRAAFGMPTSGGVESCPLTVAMTGSSTEAELVLSASHALAGEGRLDALAERLQSGLRA